MWGVIVLMIPDKKAFIQLAVGVNKEGVPIMEITALDLIQNKVFLDKSLFI